VRSIVRPQTSRTSHRRSPALLAVLAAWAAIGCGRHDARRRAIEIGWREGARYVYTARLATHAGLAGQSPFDVELTTGLELVALRVAGARAELAMTLVGPRLSVGGRAVPDADPMAAALARPLLFTLEGGKIVDQRLPAGLPAPVVGMHRTFAAAFQLAQPGDQQKDGWTAREYDATGGYDAAYAWGAEPGVVAKRKLQYAEVLVAGNADPTTRSRVAAKIAASSGALRVKDRALASINAADTVTSQVLLKSELSVETRLAIDLKEIAAPRPDAPGRDALLAATVALPVTQAYGSGASNGMFDKARLDGRTFEQLAAALEAEARDPAPGSEGDRTRREAQLSERVGTFGAMVALLRAQPEAIGKAAAKARAGSRAAHGLMDALASAGSDAAQAALVALMVDGKRADDARIAAADSLIRVQHPSKKVIDTLEALLADPLLREHAVYGLGTASRRLREAGDADRARAIAERLVTLLRAARKPEDQIRCLRGVANSAYAGALEGVRPLLASPDTSVRVAAIEATRLMDAPAVDAFIATPMAKDGESRVRRAAVDVASLRPASATLEGALTAVALGDADAANRQHAVELLGRWLVQNGKLRAVLEKVAANDDRPEIREAAKSALALQKA
jgi:hypothetical protein